MCDLEAIGVPSIFKTIRSVESLVRLLPTLDLSCESAVLAITRIKGKILSPASSFSVLSMSTG